MGILTERIEKANKELSKSGGELAGIDLVDDREKAIVERHKSELQGGSLMQRAAKGLASLEIKDRRQKREYAENPPTLLSKTTVDFAREMLANLGDRARVLDVYRKLSPEQREEALRLAPGIAQIGGDDRGGFIGRAGSSLARGVSAVSQPIMELAGQVTGTDWGGSAEEIDFIRKLEGAAAQEFNPARPGDPWYERGPVQAAEMLPWMATTVGGAGAGRAVVTGIAGRLAGSAAAGSKIAGAVQKAGQAVGGMATAGKVGELAGITAAAFPSQYAQEVDQLKALGMADDAKLRLLAGGTAAVTGLVEGIVPNPFGASVPLKEGAVKAARQYLWEAAKKAPGEMTEEYLQGVVSGLGEHVSQYIATQETGVGEDGNPAKKSLKKKSIADAFDKGWQQAQEAALPMAFLLGGSAVGGAALSAARAANAPDALQTSFGQSGDTMSQNAPEASRMPPVAPVQPSPPPLPPGAPPAPMQPPVPPQPPAVPNQPTLTPEAMSRIAALETRPSAHKWAEIVLGDRKLFKQAPSEAERVQAWEQSRAASQTQGGAVPPIPGQVPVTTEGVDNGVRQQSEPQVEQGVQQGQQSQAAVGQNAGGQVNEERMRNEAQVRAQMEADRAQRLAARSQQQGGQTPPDAPEVGAIGEKTTVMGTPVTRSGSFTDVDNIRYELFESQDGKSGVVRSMDVDSGNVVSMKKYPSVSSAKKAFEQEQGRQQQQPTAAPPELPKQPVAFDDATGHPKFEDPANQQKFDEIRQRISNFSKPPTQALWAKTVYGDASRKDGVPDDDTIRKQWEDARKAFPVRTVDSVGNPIPEKVVAARKEFFEKAKPGVSFTHSGYEGSTFKILDDGSLVDTSSARRMGNVESFLEEVKPGQVKWQEAQATKEPESKQEAAPSTSWVKYGDDSYGVKIDDPAVGSAEATMSYIGDEPYIYVDMFASKKDAPKGSGKKLLRSIVESAKRYDPRFISGNFTNPAALGAFASEFGKENVTFIDKRRGQEVSISFEEAMRSPASYIARVDLAKASKPKKNGRKDEARPATSQSGDNVSQKPESAMSASEIRGMLDSVRQRIAAQGRVVDDRLLSREKELARLLADAEKAEETKLKTEEISNEPAKEGPKPEQPSARTMGQDRVPISELGVKGNSATVSTADGKTRKVTYYAVEADSLIPSHDARNKFSKNEGALENERPYHDPKQGADSRDTVEKISKLVSDKMKLLTSDTPSPIDGPPILDAFGAVLGGNARSMGMQLAYAGEQAPRLKEHMQLEASKFGIDAEQIKKLKEPVIVRVLDEVFDKATISALLNQALSAAMSQPTVAVSQAKRVSESTIDLISGILSSDDTLSLRDAMANPKHADRIVSALMKDGAWSSKDKDRFVDPVTADLNSDGKSAIEQLLTAKVIPDASILGEVAPSVKQKVLAAIGPLAKGMADKKHGRQLLSDMLEAVQAYDGYATDKKAGGSLQSYFMDQGQLIAGPGYRNYTAAGLVHALHEMSPTKFRNAMKELVSALGIGEKTASLFNEMNETFETLPEAIKSVIDPPLRDAPVTAPAQTDADADMKALIESIMDEEDAVKPPAKKKTGRKEQGGPAPAPRKKTGKKQKTTEEAKTPLKSAADQARKEADDIWAEWTKQSSSKLTTGLDGDLARLAVRLVLAEIKANTLTFAAFVEKTVAKLPAELLEKSKPYMEMAWKVAYERKKTEDPGGKFDDYMKKGDENEQSVYDGTGESDKEGTVRGGSDGQESGGSATSGALEETQPADGQATGGAGVAGGLRDGDSGSIQQGGDEAVADGADSNVGGGTGVTGDVAAGSGDEAGFTKPGDGAGIHLAPKSSRPNFHLTNPDVIIGRGLKDKFARNVRALELSQELEESGRPPTQEDLEILASYIGWGAFGQELFQGNWNNPKVKKEWVEENEWLREHLGEEEWRSAQESIPNAHYTDPEVVSGVWTMLQKMGFNGGRFLEPSFGVGNFAALMPRDIMGRTNFTAIELDKATARIAKILYPQINVQQKAYQDSKTPNDFYDVTATNVPFGNYKIHDRTYRMPYSVHNYFFRKAIDQTKPGGIMAFITSNMTMDGKDEAKFLRKQLSDRGDLIAAFRFPTGAFERYAKTKVVADLIIIRKRRPGDAPSKTNEEWIDVVDVDTPSGQKTSVNNYWTLHPENVLGTLNYGNGTTSGRPGMVVNKPDDLESRWQKAIESVPENILNTDRSPEEGKERPNERKLRQNTVVHQNDELYIAKGEQLMPLKEYVNWYTKGSKPETIKKKRDEIVSLLKVRDALEKVLEVQGKGDDASAQRKELNQAYDAFVGEYGPVSESKALEKLKGSGDAIANAVASLEKKTPSGEYEKRPVFTKNTVRQPPRVNEKLDPVDAFALARNNSVDIDWDKVAYSARMPKKDVIAALEAKGMIYKVGEDAYDAADVFLSGNMARKIRQLEAAKNEGVAGLDRSIKAARDAMPEPLAYNQIQVSLGAPWITAKDYSQFFADLLNDSPKNTTIIKAARGWKVQFPPSTNRLPGVVTHGHSEVAFSKLVAAAMNNGRVSVYYEDADGNKIRDDIATAEANAKIDELKDKFKDWIWQTPDRIARLSQAYNEDHRSVVTPDWNNIEVPLLFEGLALQRGDDPFSLRKHQEAAVWRGIVSGKGLFAHEVGTGKTLTMAALAIESRRLRLANKPVIFAHNANSEAVYREAQEAYPGAKILYVNNLDPKNKGQAMASIATEDWDLIVIPHSLVENLKMRPETLEKLLQDQMDQLEAAALEAYEEDDSPFKGNMPGDLDNISKDDLKSLRSRTAKELVKERLRLRERIRAAQADAANESTVFIEDMGIDMLMVDEAHIFKKIPLATRQQVKGLNKRASNPGNSLLLLSDYIRGTQNGRGVFLFTGTPITNTLNEIYNMQRFIMPDEMEAVGVKDWDGWFSTFATSESSDELSAGGTYEEFERLTSFVNLPELRASIGQYMDTVFGSDMPEFIPRDRKEGRVEEGEPVIGRPYKEVHNETLQMMPVQKRLSEQLKERYRTLREATGKHKYELMRTREYMPLVINNEGVKLALDPRLMDGVSPSSIDPRDPRLKVNKMVVNAMDYYYSHPKATQMIFMEIGHTDSTERVVGRDNDGNPITERVKIFNLAKEIKRRLMEEGVAESEIAIFSAMTKEQRSLAARAMNRGEIRFAIGGTETLGTGVNAQENLVAMHHMDAPWMPGALEQRNGRGHRQGNRWNTVHEHRYLTEGPQDGRRWQVLLTKDRFISRFMHHKGDERVIDMSDVDMDEGGQGDFEATFSAAVGDPRIQQRFRLEKEIAKLEDAKNRHHRTIQDSLWESYKQETQDLPHLREVMNSLLSVQEAYRNSRPEKGDAKQSAEPSMIVMKSSNEEQKVVTGSEAITQALEQIQERYSSRSLGQMKKVGEYRGVDVFTTGDVMYVGNSRLEIKPAFSSLDGILRNVGKRIENYREEYGRKLAFINSAKESAKLPFVRQAQLDAKKSKLAALTADMEENPQGSPFWFRNMAPVGSSIYIRKKKRAAGRQAFDDMQAEMYREALSSQDADQNARYEFEEHAVAGYRSDTHITYEDGTKTVAVPIKDVLNEQGDPIFKDIEDVRAAQEKADDISSPELDKKLEDLPDTLAQMESGDVDASIRKQVLDIAMAAEDAGIKTFDKLVAYSVKSVGERRTREIGAYLRLAAEVVGFSGVRSTSEVLGNPGVTREQFVAMAKAAFPSLTDEQIDTAVGILERTGLSFDKIGFAPFGSPVPTKLQEIAQQGKDSNVKGWTQFVSATRAIIGATDKADVSTFIHEMFHPMRSFLLNRKVPLAERQGITDADIMELEKYAGVKYEKDADGNDDFSKPIWDREAEEKAAMAWEQYWFEGRSPSKPLAELFKKIARWMRGVYSGIYEITGGQLPSEVRALFGKLVQRSGDQESGDIVSQNEDPVTSIKNEVVNELRFRRGFPGLVDVASETQEEWLEAAEAMLRNDPMLGDRLVKEINNKARNLSNIEVAVMQIHYRQVNNQLIEASDRLFKAKNKKDAVASAQALTDTDIIQNALAEIEEATKAAGREWGRAGVARQIELAKDFSLGALIRKARIANAGNALNEEQLAKIRELAARVAELEGDLARANQEKADLERQKNVDAQIEDSKKKATKVPEAIRRKAVDSLTAFKNKFAAVFALSSNSDSGTLYATQDEMMADEAKFVVQAYVDIGVFSFGEFMANVRKDLGSELPVSARAAFATAWQELHDNGDIPSPMVDKNDVRGLTRLAKQIERALVEAGITERDAVVQGVWESLQEIIPEITRRETMDAMSGYGQYSLLSTDEIDVIIRDINGQLQQLAKLEDMRAGIAPAKTGVQRREPSDEERRLTAEVNEAKRRGGFTVTDPESQLKTAIDAAKTAIRNRIKDIQFEIDRKERIVRTRTDTKSDPELIELRKQRDDLMKQHREVFPKPEATMDQRIAATNRVLDRVIEDLEEQLRTGEFDAKKQAQPISTPELDAKRARVEALRAQRDALKGVQKRTPEQIEKAYKANLLKQIADYKDRMANSDFDPKPRKELRVLSKEEIDLKLELADVKDKFFRLARSYRLANMSPGERVWDYIKETAHLSRALMTSIDASAVFRQGGAVAFAHPVMGAAVARDMYKAMWSRRSEFDTAEKIRKDDLYQFAITAGLQITEEEGKITRQEEAFMGRWAREGFGSEGSALNKASKFLLIPVSSSARGYITFLNGIRFQLFKHLVSNLGRGGQVTKDEAQVIAMYINAATGRSDLGPMMRWAEQMNMVFFAPRFVASRFQYLGLPLWLLGSRKVSGRVKKAIALEYARHAAGVMSFLGLTVALGSLLGGDDEEEKPTVSLDPRSSDFLKIKLGETRIDPMSGLSQVIVLASRIATGKRVRDDGTVVSLRGEDEQYASSGVPGVVGNFLRSKLAPIPGAVFDIAAEENVVGQTMTPYSSIVNLFFPLSIREIRETAESRGIPQGALITLLSLHGMGASTYGPESKYRTATPEKRKELFEKDLKRMKFDSPDPQYKEYLTREQLTQISRRREEKQQSLVYAASTVPNRKAAKSVESFNQSVSEQKAALESLRRSGITLTEARRLLVKHWESAYGSAKEMRGGVPVYKAALSDRLQQLRKVFSK